ncbi:HEPN domain-containing protein [Aquitalea sp. LB_tupeE]|uniref:HEPN domain-containing protein n=1 Tax=Aquitalea sp. LB_tupeE TaxID=2748078 RepID=UPI0015C07ACA|nr:HEPN domain-containing protein [Aquitalea sp. LB_tupeE]NWK80314.1 HEPN domain-containing protein [Aquitalea sp. LB_tupeE]
MEKEISINNLNKFALTIKEYSKNEKLSHVDIAYNAKAYLLAGVRCLEEVKIPGGVQVLVGPGIVCHAFSIELLLKALLHFHDIEIKRIHKINELFSLLDESIKKEIKSKYEAIIPKPGFESIINQAERLFVKIRYEHEESNIEFPETEIQILNKIFYDYCQELWDLK